MMRKKIILLVALIVLISGCSVPGDVIKATYKVESVGGQGEDININAEFPSFAKEGHGFSLKLEVTPKYDIKDFNLEIYEKCPLIEFQVPTKMFVFCRTGSTTPKWIESSCTVGYNNADYDTFKDHAGVKKCEELSEGHYNDYDVKGWICEMDYGSCICKSKEEKWNFPEIDAGRMKIITAKYKVIDNIPYEGECKIKFKANYNSSASVIQSIAVLYIGEYEFRETEGTLGEIEVGGSKTENPLDVKISFSEEQPFMDDSEIKMYIDYENAGSGFIDGFDIYDVSLSYPSNLELGVCDDYVDAISFRECKEYKSGEGIISVDTNDDGILDTFKWVEAVDDPLPENVRALNFKTPEGYKIGVNDDENKVYIFGLYDAPYYIMFELDNSISEEECKTTPISIDKSVETLANRIVLNKNLNFYNKKAKRSTCSFTTKSNQIIDTGPLNLDAKYKYKVYGNIENNGKGIDIIR